MFAHNNITLIFVKILTLIFLLFSISFAQKEHTDLKIEVQSPVELIRGGEEFSYTFTITNTGTTIIEEAYFRHDQPELTKFISFTSSKGDCKKDQPSRNWDEPILRCKIGEIGIGENVYIFVQAKTKDWGDISLIKDSKASEKNSDTEEVSENSVDLNRRKFELFAIKLLEKLESRKGGVNSGEYSSSIHIIGRLSVNNQYQNNIENDEISLTIKLLPSLNAPPRVKIISPQPEVKIERNLDKDPELVFNVEAFDTDGKIKRVFTGNNNVSIELEGKKVFYILDGKKVSPEEIKENYEEYRKYLEVDLTKIDENKYQYRLKDLFYGLNAISVAAVDDGGRETSSSFYLTIEGDANVKIVSPTENKIIEPNSNIIIKVAAEINDPTLDQLRIIGVPLKTMPPPAEAVQMPIATQKDYHAYLRKVYELNIGSIPLLQQTSRNGNKFEYQYFWKNVPEGHYSFTIKLFKDLYTETNTSETVSVIVAYPRIIKITSLEDGQVFDKGQPIAVMVEARDIKGNKVSDRLELLLNGKKVDEIINSLCEECYPKQEILNNLKKGVYNLQVVAKTSDGGDVKIGESKPITITVK